MAHDSLSERIAAAARELEGEFGQSATMDKAVSLSVQVVPSAQEAGISLLHGRRGRIDTPAATSDLVRRIDESNAFDDDDREHGLAIAAHMAIAVAAVQEIDHLKAGMDSRGLIGQAQGILMERFDLDADRAFAVLTRLASHANRKLRVIALEIVETRRLPPGSRS